MSTYPTSTTKPLYDGVHSANAKYTNAVNRGGDPKELRALKANRVLSMIASRAEKIIADNEVYLTDEQASVLTAIVTGRGRDV